MKVYISLPTSGFPLDTVKKRADKYKKRFQAEGFEAITPFDVCSDPVCSCSFYLGKTIEALIDCDAIYLAPGWHGSKGCTAEYEVARVFNKTIII